MIDTLIVSHANCMDGTAAAWVAHRKFGDSACYFFGHHDGVLPHISSNIKNIYVFDYSFSKDQLIALSKEVNIKVYDHHISAQKDLEGLDFCLFDLNRSGAGLAWDYLFEGQPRPKLIDYIEDRDLWLNKMPFSKAVSAYIQTIPLNFMHYSLLNTKIEKNLDDVIKQGEAILGFINNQVDRLTHPSKVLFQRIGGFTVPTVNSNTLQSEIANKLLDLYEDYEFSAVFGINSENKKTFSLRSRGFDVSSIAKIYGGGGHTKAAGFIKE